MHRLTRLLVATSALLLTLWLYIQVCLIGGPAGTNIENAAEAGVPDTVSQSTWIALWVSMTALIVVLTIGLGLGVRPLAERFRWYEILFVASMPIAATALLPLIGFFGPIFGFWICLFGFGVRQVRLRYLL